MKTFNLPAAALVHEASIGYFTRLRIPVAAVCSMLAVDLQAQLLWL